MAETQKWHDAEHAEEKDRQPPRRERVERGESEWVLEQIQQTFDTPRD
jgi:hypothetical protein